MRTTRSLISLAAAVAATGALAQAPAESPKSAFDAALAQQRGFAGLGRESRNIPSPSAWKLL